MPLIRRYFTTGLIVLLSLVALQAIYVLITGGDPLIMATVGDDAGPTPYDLLLAALGAAGRQRRGAALAIPFPGRCAGGDRPGASLAWPEGLR